MADVGAEIQRVEEEIDKVQDDIEQRLSGLKALDAQLQSSGLSESEAGWLRARERHLYREVEQLGTEEGQLYRELEPPKLRLRQDPQHQDLFFFEPVDTAGSATAAASAGVGGAFFLDPEGRQVEELQVWLGFAEKGLRAGQPTPPLFVHGLVKTGKSYLLNQVLPAVANARYGSGGGGRQHTTGTGALPEPNFLHVDVLDCNRSGGCGGFLVDFLRKLKRSAADQQLYAAASTPIPSDRSAGAVADAIDVFLRHLPRDRLNFLLVDEAQSFYLLEGPVPVSEEFPPRGPPLDWGAVEHMRRILKRILLASPPWIAWAVTGSAMGTLWANVAATPTHGTALMLSHFRINLSPTVSRGVLQVGWEQLKAQAASWDPPLPSDLVWRSPPQIAMLAYLCKEWRYSHTASTAAELVQQTLTQKLIPEDLRMVLQVLGKPTSRVLLLRQLLDPTAGADCWELPPAFEALLGPSATERDGRLYLDDPLLFAQVVQAATTESGELLDPITPIPSLSSSLFGELAALGECCRDKGFGSYGDLRSLLQDMASALALTPDGLREADWFAQVRDHRCNSRGSKADFERDYGAQPDVQVGLRWYHVLLHNVLSHAPFPEQAEFLEAYPPQLAAFHSSGRISQALTRTYGSAVLTKTYDNLKPRRRPARVAPAAAAATPRAQVQPRAGPARPMALHWGKRLGRAAVNLLRHV
ncbi:hypothetical protein HYH03_013805 [Edaphochlamys debaryana]|uniref:Uncharacterized protein n=1 Tax=Edaphochlamys debaryana TaxID=47281 RepID=A0A836BU44_9CHLO|nr:hypothetical protein HYH03_013805 [Edaphochlamys debaryana]|eukprot:KAG2487524.1 hypothetical protein HYH03_013805 [Edaphochlamys debaryana]